MGDVVQIRRPVPRPRGCGPAARDAHADLRADLLMLAAAARAVLDARSRGEQRLALARLGAALAAHDRGGVLGDGR